MNGGPNVDPTDPIIFHQDCGFPAFSLPLTRGRKSHVLWRHCHPESFCAPGKFLRVTMKSTIKRHAKMHRFPDGLETIQMAWKLSRWPGNLTDGLETFQMVCKLSRWPGNFPDGLETFQMTRKLSRCSGNFPDGLETFQMV